MDRNTWILLGTSIGVLFGIALAQVLGAAGFGVGLSLGIGIGLTFGSLTDPPGERDTDEDVT